MQNYIKKNLVLAVGESVLSMEINGIHLVSLKPFVEGHQARIGKEAFDLVVVVYKL